MAYSAHITVLKIKLILLFWFFYKQGLVISPFLLTIRYSNKKPTIYIIYWLKCTVHRGWDS